MLFEMQHVGAVWNEALGAVWNAALGADWNEALGADWNEALGAVSNEALNAANAFQKKESLSMETKTMVFISNTLPKKCIRQFFGKCKSQK